MKKLLLAIALAGMFSSAFAQEKPTMSDLDKWRQEDPGYNIGVLEQRNFEIRNYIKPQVDELQGNLQKIEEWKQKLKQPGKAETKKPSKD